MRGKDGILLSDLWARNLDGYLSVAVHRCQTIFPLDAGRTNFTIANGPLLSAFGFMSEYVFKWALKMAGEGIESVTVESDVTEDGYRTGITANHPREILSEIIGEDFDIEYLNPVNRWAQIVGNGLTERDAEDRDLAPYLATHI
jgi:hypothetical protein